MLAVSTVELAVMIDSMAERAGKDLTDAQLVAAAERELAEAGVEEARQRLLDAVGGSGEVLVAERRAAVARGLWDGGRAPWALLSV